MGILFSLLLYVIGSIIVAVYFLVTAKKSGLNKPYTIICIMFSWVTVVLYFIRKLFKVLIELLEVLFD